MAGNNYLSPSYSTNQIGSHAGKMSDGGDNRGSRIHGDGEPNNYYQRSHSIGCDMSSASNANNKNWTWTDELNTKEQATFISDKNSQSKKCDDNWFGGFPNEGSTDGLSKVNLTDSTLSGNNCLTETQFDSENSYQRYNKPSVPKSSEKYFDDLDVKKKPTTPSPNAKTPLTKKTTTAEDDAWNLLID